MGKEFKKNMDIIKNINLLMKEGMGDDKAFKTVGENFYKDKRTIRDKYSNYEKSVFSKEEKFKPYKVAHVTNNVLEAIDSYLKEKGGG